MGQHSNQLSHSILFLTLKCIYTCQSACPAFESENVVTAAISSLAWEILWGRTVTLYSHGSPRRAQVRVPHSVAAETMVQTDCVPTSSRGLAWPRLMPPPPLSITTDAFPRALSSSGQHRPVFLARLLHMVASGCSTFGTWSGTLGSSLLTPLWGQPWPATLRPLC